jgi:hypothetical protein
MLNAENATVPANVPFVKGKVIVRIRKFGVTALKTVTPFLLNEMEYEAKCRKRPLTK